MTQVWRQCRFSACLPVTPPSLCGSLVHSQLGPSFQRLYESKDNCHLPATLPVPGTWSSFFFFLLLGFWTFTLSHSTSPFLWRVFQNRVLQTIFPDWLGNVILLISVSWVAGITGGSHGCPAAHFRMWATGSSGPRSAVCNLWAEMGERRPQTKGCGQRLREAKNGFFLGVQRECGLLGSAPKLGENRFLLFSVTCFVVICHGHHGGWDALISPGEGGGGWPVAGFISYTDFIPGAGQSQPGVVSEGMT
jgi:hypothetical protein